MLLPCGHASDSYPLLDGPPMAPCSERSPTTPCWTSFQAFACGSHARRNLLRKFRVIGLHATVIVENEAHMLSVMQQEPDTTSPQQTSNPAGVCRPLLPSNNPSP